MTTLDDLKRAIDDFENLKDDEVRSAAVRGMDAWRTACNWLLQYASTSGDQYPEFMEGMALIREKLK